MFIRFHLTACLLLLSLLLTACGVQSEDERGGGSDEMIVGITACDAYVAAHTSCIESKIPMKDRAAMNEQLKGRVRAWQRLAADAATRDGLADMCSSELRNAGPALRKLGCEAP